MAEKLKLDIVTPYGSVFSGEVDEVSASGSEGEFGILPEHARFVTTLKIGMLRCKSGGSEQYFFVNWGYAEVGPDSIVVLADSAEESADIDVERAKAAKQRAEERIKKAAEIDFTRAESSLDRSLMRLQVAERKMSQ